MKSPFAFPIVLLLCSVIPLSCAGTRPYTPLEISMDRRVIEAIQGKSAGIRTIHAALGLRPAGIASPELDAYLIYKREGLFRLTGLTPAGFTLFKFETADDLFTLSLPNGRQISGSAEELMTGIKGAAGIDLPADPGIVREAIDFYGSDLTEDTHFLIEELEDYYLLNQLKNRDDLSYPIRRWWIDKREMTVARKEIFSRLPDRGGERLLDIVYGDFRAVNDIRTPFDILVKGDGGQNLFRMRLHKVEYNR